MRFFTFLSLFLATILFSCSKKPTEFKPGIWRGVLEIQEQQLPFNFDVEKSNDQYIVHVKNAAEKITLDEVILFGDSVKIVMNIYDAEIRARIEENSLTGRFYKNYDATYKIPFTATFGEDFRFEKTGIEPTVDFSGKYDVELVTDTDTTTVVGVFTQKGNYVEGTFLSTTGDYRYFEGSVSGNTMQLSEFEGNFVYLLKADKNDSIISGDFWSGKTYHAKWRGVKNDNAALPDAGSLTYLKKGYEKIDFTFPDVNGKNVSSSDEKFKGKVVILQIFGTWCPNCIDETKFLSPWYKENKDRGVEIIGLSYERKPDFDYASARVKKMLAKLDVDYDFLIAGTNDLKATAASLPALNHVMAFPTSIFIGKDGKVKHIHTGFSGPGTGVYYEQYKEEFNQRVSELLAEK
jgi:thiol-disulfide isomerase/thioredoxin